MLLLSRRKKGKEFWNKPVVIAFSALFVYQKFFHFCLLTILNHEQEPISRSLQLP